MTPSVANAKTKTEPKAADPTSNRQNPMLEWLKTSTGAYNLQFIIAIIAWLIGGIGLVAGFHLNKVKTIEAEAKAKKAEAERSQMAAKLESANTKTAELERALAPRVLNDEQVKQIASLLSAAAKDGKATVPIVVASRMMDAESLAYGRQILGAIGGAGWQVCHTELSTHSFSGLTIFPNPPLDTDPLKAVVETFNQSGVPFSTQVLDVHRTPIQQEPAIYIIIGHK